MVLHGTKLKPPAPDPAAQARANLVAHARKWRAAGKPPRTEEQHSERMYGKDSKAKRETTTEAKHPPRQHIRGTHHRD